MRGKILLRGGGEFTLPPLLSWELTRTGGVPCDSFRVRCCADAETVKKMDGAARFAALDGGETALLGVVDEWSADYGADGFTLEVGGRGMAARLLDNECEAGCYESATMLQLLRDMAEPYGIVCRRNEASAQPFALEISAGASRYAALEAGAKLCGVVPYFTADGVLELRRSRGTHRGVLPTARIISALRRDKRYGVISRIVLIDRKSGEKTELRGRGDFCERVLYSADEAAAREKIERSSEDRRALMLTLAGVFAAEPGDTYFVSLPRLGVEGNYRVAETQRRADSRGEVTELTFWEV